jgi:hypothetical protein
MKFTALKRTISGILLALLLCLASPVQARTSGHSHSHSRTSTSRAGKSVHVRSYTKKNGTHVRAYNRRPPNSK